MIMFRVLWFSPPGIRVTYNLYKPEGSRVVDLQVLCTKCRVPEYVPIEDSTSYQFIAPAFIVSGGDGYSMIKKHMTKHHIFGKNENVSDSFHNSSATFWRQCLLSRFSTVKLLCGFTDVIPWSFSGTFFAKFWVTQI